MLKITHSIVDDKRSLIGFIIKGTEKEFGSFSSNVIETGVPVCKLINDKFTNNQISVINGKIVERNKFKICDLPMVVYDKQSGGYNNIDNSVNIISRFVQNNENIGFRLKFADGSEDNLKYANVILLCKWFKPGNFSIRSSSTGNQYICGKKGGVNIDDFPAVIIDEKPKAKRTKSAAKPAQTEFNGAIESGFDIIDVYDFIRDCNGCIIKLPGEEYKAATPDGKKIVEGFTPLGIGEVATATPIFGNTKINATAGFKKVGIVPVNINGQNTNITTFVYRNKSIFLNGDNYMKKFGIAIPVEKEKEVVEKLGRSLAVEKIEDAAITQPLGQVIDAKNLVFYSVDSSKIDLISAKKRESSILTASQLYALVLRYYELKLISKAMGPKGGLMKTIKKSIGEDAVAEAKGKKLVGIFSMMNEDALRVIKEAGIDVYTGAYTEAGVSQHSESGDSAKTESIEIDYAIKGYDVAKVTGAKILDYCKSNATTKLPADVIKTVNSVLSHTDLKEQYEIANNLYKATEQKVSELNRQLWMHKASMFINGNKTKIHSHDSSVWIPDTSSKATKATSYICTEKNLEGLTVKFTGVTI